MFSEYSKFTLKNNLRVITVPMKGVSSATVLVLVGTGSRYEDKNKMGLSHFLEHMFFKGTKKRPTAFEISSLVDSVGGENNAFTGKDQTGYYIKLQSQHVEMAFDILSDTLLDSIYDPIEIEREKGTIIEEINMYEDTPLYKIDDVFTELMYDGHPLGYSTAGDKKTVSNVNRKDFVDCTNRFYQGSDMVLVVAGGINEKKVRELAEKYFSGFTSGSKEKINIYNEVQKVPQIKIKYKETDQAHLYFGYPALSFLDPDVEALEVLETILGGGMSSRLFIEVRERRGLAYYIKATGELFHETGYIAARAGLNLNKIEEAVTVIREEFEKIKTGDVSEEELKKAKDCVKGRTALRLENSLAVAEWYADKELLEERIETPDQTFAKIDKVTLDDIKRIANKFFLKEKSNLALIGPFKNQEKLLGLLS